MRKIGVFKLIFYKGHPNACDYRTQLRARIGSEFAHGDTTVVKRLHTHTYAQPELVCRTSWPARGKRAKFVWQKK